MENFMTAGTKMEDLVEKQTQITRKAGSLLSQAMTSKINAGSVSNNTAKDIMNLIRNFNTEDQVKILVEAMVLLSMQDQISRMDQPEQKRGKSNKHSGEPRSRSEIFGNW